MFRCRALEFDAIADWLGRAYEDRILLEPINVLWLDAESTTLGEAQQRVVAFLDQSGFRESRLHSSGYSAAYGDTSWVGQFPEGLTWRNAPMPRTNAHGRVFPALVTVAGPLEHVYITFGAFSSETGILHSFISFNDARDSLKPSDGWVELELEHIGNEYPPIQSDAGDAGARGKDPIRYTTADHNGVRVFLLTAGTL